jgi:hypothetical protein
MQSVYDTISIDNVTLNEKTPVLNMLNTKYIVLNKGISAVQNKGANGPAWFVHSIKKVANSNEEMLALKLLVDKSTALVNAEDAAVKLNSNYPIDSSASIRLVKYGTDELTYSVNAKTELPAIFSEIYYPEGWNCYADNKQIIPFRANYVLRGALIPAGTKTVVWKFEPQSFYTASTIALIGSLLLIFSALFILGKALVASLKEENVLAIEK